MQKDVQITAHHTFHNCWQYKYLQFSGDTFRSIQLCNNKSAGFRKYQNKQLGTIIAEGWISHKRATDNHISTKLHSKRFCCLNHRRKSVSKQGCSITTKRLVTGFVDCTVTPKGFWTLQLQRWLAQKVGNTWRPNFWSLWSSGISFTLDKKQGKVPYNYIRGVAQSWWTPRRRCMEMYRKSNKGE